MCAGITIGGRLCWINRERSSRENSWQTVGCSALAKKATLLAKSSTAAPPVLPGRRHCAPDQVVAPLSLPRVCVRASPTVCHHLPLFARPFCLCGRRRRRREVRSTIKRRRLNRGVNHFPPRPGVGCQASARLAGQPAASQWRLGPPLVAAPRPCKQICLAR